MGLVAALPALLRAKRRVGSNSSMEALVRPLDPPTPRRRRVFVSTDDLDWGLRAALQVLGPRSDACVPRGLAMFGLLSARRRPAAFVSGVGRADGNLVGHAWVLTPDRTYDEDRTGTFEINYRYENRWWSEPRS